MVTHPVESRTILRLQLATKQQARVDDVVSVDFPLHVIMNGLHCITMTCTPDRLEDLVTGYLLSEGIVDKVSQVAQIRLSDGKCEVELAPELNLQKRLGQASPFYRVVTSECGGVFPSPFAKLMDRLSPPKLTDVTPFKASAIECAVGELNREASIYRQTGGVHAASICDRSGRLEHLAEDVGRHNAVDKVIGRCARSGGRFEDMFLVSTGRLTGEIIMKAARVRIPVVASISAVLSSGIDAAEKTGLTAIGFVRGRRMNIYSHPERIQTSG
jgi:FdhD protein